MKKKVVQLISFSSFYNDNLQRELRNYKDFYESYDLEVINYDKDIDLTKLPSDYMLVRDLSGIVYLATFFKVAGKKYTDNIDQYLKPEEVATILGIGK